MTTTKEARVLAVLLVLGPVFDPATAASGQGTPARQLLVEDLRLGSIDGPAALSAVHALTMSPDGRLIFVGQSRAAGVKVFDIASGAALRTIGRAGEGPGEFRTISHLTARPDTLFVADRLQQRLALFRPGGEHLETLRIRPPQVVGSPLPAFPIAPAAGDLVWADALRHAGALAVGDTAVLPVVLVRRTGEVVRVVAERRVAGSRTTAAGGGRVFVFLQPFGVQHHYSAFALDGSGLALVKSTARDGARGGFRVTLLSAAGDTVYSRGFRLELAHVSTADRDSIWQVWAERFAGSSRPAAALAMVKEHVHVPDLLPPLADALLATDGRVWLRRQRLSGPGAEWLVLDDDGHLAAIVAAPAGADLLLAGPDHAWGVVTDVLDVPYVVRYRVVEAS